MSICNEKESIPEEIHEPVIIISSPADDHQGYGSCDEVLKADDDQEEKKALNGLSILLVEDHPLLQKVGEKMLEKLGASVTVAGDGLQALAALNCTLPALNLDPTVNAPHFDLILMDCQMPNMNGYEATKEIRKAEAEAKTGMMGIPIVAFTTLAPEENADVCFEAGMDAYVRKPAAPEAMATAIIEAINQKRLKFAIEAEAMM